MLHCKIPCTVLASSPARPGLISSCLTLRHNKGEACATEKEADPQPRNERAKSESSLGDKLNFSGS